MTAGGAASTLGCSAGLGVAGTGVASAGSLAAGSPAGRQAQAQSSCAGAGGGAGFAAASEGLFGSCPSKAVDVSNNTRSRL